MTIPALSTIDKSFICSYVIGSNVDHRLAIGVINEITTYTTEYIDGFCWIPVCAPLETNDHSWYWDVGGKDIDIVYVKVGVRISADGYIHSWFLDTQEVSELILWNNHYNTANSPIGNSTTLHWVIEKIYQQVIGNTTGFVAENIKFQTYISGTERLYLFGNYSNGTTHPVIYLANHPTNVKSLSIVWYPNNSTGEYGDLLYSSLNGYTSECDGTFIGYDNVEYASIYKVFVYGYGYTGSPPQWGLLGINDITDAANSSDIEDCPLTYHGASESVIYFGFGTKCHGIKFMLSSGIPANHIAWSNWHHNGWRSLNSVVDTSNGMNRTGQMTFKLETGFDNIDLCGDLWEHNTVNGVSAYWIKVTGREL